MFQNGLLGAAHVHERIRQDRQAVEGTLLVDGAAQIDDVRCQPARLDGDGTERVAEDVSNEPGMYSPLALPRPIAGLPCTPIRPAAREDASDRMKPACAGPRFEKVEALQVGINGFPAVDESVRVRLPFGREFG
jgi:hypothetical protein